MSSETILRPRRFLGALTALWLLVSGLPSPAPAQTFKIIHTFNGPDGSQPSGPLLQDSDGSFYGTTSRGGASDHGTVFRLAADDTLTTFYSFGATDDAYPQTGVIKGSDGNFYGSTDSIYYQYGTVFRLTPDGTLTTLTEPVGGTPNALVVDSGGNFYGTTQDGGVRGYGTVFKVAPDGALDVLVNFNGDNSGQYANNGGTPRDGLLQGADDNFYGTTLYGGDSGGGTVFHLASNGKLNTLYSFVYNGEIEPEAALIRGSDGAFYGSTAEAPASIFRITADGKQSVLAGFDGTNGQYLGYALLLGHDSNFYGVTTGSDVNYYGSIFRLTPAGVLTTLHSFTSSEGVPLGSLVQGSDGNFYGVTDYNGDPGDGAIYRLLLHPLPGKVQFAPATYAAQEADGSVTLQVSRSQDSTAAATVHFATANGSAVAGRDYRGNAGTVSWAEGDVTPKSIKLVLLDPKVYDHATRQFSVQLSEPTGGVTLGSPVTAEVAILDALPLVINSPQSAFGTSGEPFQYQITANTNPAHFGAENLPDGLSVDPTTGLISGTHTGAGFANVTLHAYNGGRMASAPLGLGFQVAFAPVITSAITARGEIGQAFAYQITADGGPTRFGVQGLPPGFSVNRATGLVTGNPQGGGTVTLTLAAYNGTGVGYAGFTLTIQNAGSPLITSAATAAGRTNALFSYQIAASHAPTSFAVSDLPAGLAVDAATGRISGTPRYAGTFLLTLIAANDAGKGSAVLTVTVQGIPVLLGANRASGVVDKAFSYQITASDSPTSYDAMGLPAGLSIDRTGLLSGTPTAAGTSSVTISAANAAGKRSATLTLTITN